MCGIATISLGKNRRGRVPYKLLRKLTQELMVELQVRGIDAGGIAVINENTSSKVFKKPLRPERFAVRPTFTSILETITNDTNFIMLHARATTIGDTDNNYNNHPIVAEPIVGIHNGTLHNHNQLFRRFKTSFSRDGDVDSEVIFKLYLYFRDTGLTASQAICQTASILEGAFTGALVDMRNPTQMVMFKQDRPLCVFRFPHYDMIITISEANFYARAARRLRITAQEKIEIVDDGTGLLFDLNSKKPITEELVTFDLPVTHSIPRRTHNNWLSAYG